MVQLFNCPYSFNLEDSLIYKITNPEKINSPKSVCEGLRLMKLKENPTPAYLSAGGRVWKEVPFPFDICFEKVNESKLSGRGYHHLHTEFLHEGSKVHIDYVIKWSSGPASHQSDVKVYMDDKLYANGITGGNGFGMNWGKDWPPSAIKNDYLYRLPDRFNWNGDDSLKEFKPREDGFPIKLYIFIPKDRLTFTIYDFTPDCGFDRNRLLDAIKLDEINDMFLQSGEERYKWKFIEEVVDNITGNILDDEALSYVIRSRILFNSFRVGIFNDKWGGVSLGHGENKLKEFRTNYFKSYLIFKHLALTA